MRTISVHSRAGHVPVWDGERWACPAEGCAFEPTDKDGGAMYHYEQSIRGEPMVILDSEEDFGGAT